MPHRFGTGTALQVNGTVMITEAMYSRYRSSVERLPHLDAKAAQALSWRAWFGEREAKQELVEKHLWLVVEMVERFQAWVGAPVQELMSAGNCALIRVVESYRPWQDGDFTQFARDGLLRELAGEVLPAA